MKNAHQLEQLIAQLQFNFTYLQDLVIDIKEDDMTFSPSIGLENHPSFTLGHIITAYGLTIKHLGGTYTISKQWDNLFRRKGPGDSRLPTKAPNAYPTKNELIDELKVQHNTLLKHFKEITEDKLYEKMTWRFSKYFPNTIDFLYFMCISHYSMHISQLAAWRRAMDMPSSLARL